MGDYRLSDVPDKTTHGEHLAFSALSDWARSWQRTYRQVFILSNGRRNITRISTLLHKPAPTIFETVYGLTTAGFTSLLTKERELRMEPQQLGISLKLIADKERFARAFYLRLFADFPEAAALFQHTDWNRQYSSLMATIAYVVAGVERGDNLTPALHDLGARHYRVGATAEHYPLVGATLIATFHTILGESFTKEMEDSWIQAFEIISHQMLAGANEAEQSN